MRFVAHFAANAKNNVSTFTFSAVFGIVIAELETNVIVDV